MEPLVRLAGAAQLLLVLASLAIPRVLGWRAETAKLRPLTAQVFWTYAAYIWVFNLSFAVVSAAAPAWLLDGSPLARAACAFIATYWGARLAIQFFYFDRGELGARGATRIAEAALVGLFIALTAIYAAAALWSCR
jgi:hypothetical protein